MPSEQPGEMTAGSATVGDQVGDCPQWEQPQQEAPCGLT